MFYDHTAAWRMLIRGLKGAWARAKCHCTTMPSDARQQRPLMRHQVTLGCSERACGVRMRMRMKA
eukprot:350341-Chlamydomonas_euryale.AAC.1